MNETIFSEKSEGFWRRNPGLAQALAAIGRSKVSRNTEGGDQAGVPIPDSQPEQALRDEPVGTPPRKTTRSPRFHVRVISYRQRLIDPDNAAGGSKFAIDLIRRSGVIPQDDPDTITLEVQQERVFSEEEEKTEIQVIPIEHL